MAGDVDDSSGELRASMPGGCKVTWPSFQRGVNTPFRSSRIATGQYTLTGVP